MALKIRVASDEKVASLRRFLQRKNMTDPVGMRGRAERPRQGLDWRDVFAKRKQGNWQ